MEEFDYEATRKRFPRHWDDCGWPAYKSTWRSRNHPYMRVRVTRTIDQSRVHPGSAIHEALSTGELRDGDVQTFIHWDGPLDELRRLFTYEPTERWNIDKTGFVYGSGGIDQDGRWREDGPALDVVFERAMFGGPDTWHINFEDRTPPFEPVHDWNG